MSLDPFADPTALVQLSLFDLAADNKSIVNLFKGLPFLSQR